MAAVLRLELAGRVEVKNLRGLGTTAVRAVPHKTAWD